MGFWEEFLGGLRPQESGSQANDNNRIAWANTFGKPRKVLVREWFWHPRLQAWLIVHDQATKGLSTREMMQRIKKPCIAKEYEYF